MCRLLQWTPPLVVGVVILASGAVVGASLLPNIAGSTAVRVSIAALVYPVLALISVSLVRAVAARPRLPGPAYHFPPGLQLAAAETAERAAALESLARQRGLVLRERTRQGLLRACDSCRLLKPDRCRHCRRCGHCVLLFDHHCILINSCVGYHNWKFFLLTLGYASLVAPIGLPITLYYAVRMIRNELRVATVDTVGLAFLTLASFWCLTILPFAVYFAVHVGRNCTFNERIAAKTFWPGRAPENPYDQGCLRNLTQVMGRNPVLFLLPVFTDRTDGHTFPLCEEEPHTDSSTPSP